MKRSSFHTLWMGTVGLVATVLIFLAVLLSIARFAVSQIPQYKAEFEKQVSLHLGYQVDVGDIEARLRHYHLEIVLKNSQVLDDQRRDTLLDLTELSIRFDLLALLTQQRLVIDSFTVHDLNVIAERTLNGQIKWYGLPFDSVSKSVEPSRAGASEIPAWHNALRELSERLPKTVWVKNSTLLFRDLHYNRSYHFSKINLALMKNKGAPVVAGALDLDPVLGERFRFRLELESLEPTLFQQSKWDFYAQGEQLDPHHWLWLSALPQWPDVRSGKLNAEVWLSLKGGSVDEIQGRVQGKDIDLSMPHLAQERLLINRLQGDFGFAHTPEGWVVKLGDLFLRRDQVEWQSESLSLWHRTLASETNEQSYGVQVSYLHLDDLVYLAKLIPWSSSTTIDLLNKWKPAGDFSEVSGQIRLVDQKVMDYHIDGNVHRLSFQSNNEHIRLDQIDAHIVANQTGGHVHLNGKNGEVEFSSLFKRPLLFNRLQGDLGWQRDSNGWLLQSNRLMFTNFDLSSSAVLSLFFPDSSEKSPAMRLEASLGAVDVKAVPRYYPVGIMPEKTHEWLLQSLTAGQALRADLLFNGHFADFPFDEKEGEFVVDAKVAGVTLEYHPDWPELKKIDGDLHFTGTGMEINATQGTYQDYAIGKTQVSLDSYYSPVLKVEAQGEGPAPTIASFLRQTPLTFPQTYLFKNLIIEGDSRLRLELEIPLDSKSKRKEKVVGEVDFKECRLAQAEWNGLIEKVQGTLGFNEKGVLPSRLTGLYANHPLTVDIDEVTAPNLSKTKDTRVHIGFVGNPLAFLDSSWAPMQALVNGKSRWDVDVQFGKFEDIAAEIQVDAVSNLEGISLALPEPIHKTKPSTRMPMRFKANIRNKSIQYDVALGDYLAMKAELTGGENKFHLTRGEVRFGGGRGRLPATKELVLTGNTPALNLDEWQALAGYLPKEAVSVGLPPLRLSMAVGQLRLAKQTYSNVAMTLKRQTSRYEMTMRGDDLSGYIRFSYPDFAEGVLQIELERYRYRPSEFWIEEQKTEHSPRDWPAVDLKINHLFYDNYELGKLVFKATPEALGMRIKQFELRGQGLNAQATGTWFQSPRKVGLGVVELNGEVQWPDLNSMLAGLGYSDFIKAKKGDGLFELGWEGHLLTPNLSTLSGQASFSLSNGELQSVEPGAGRFIGLLSFVQVFRRLGLDFRDFFAEGLKFDRVSGEFTFMSGNAQVEGLFIDAPSAFVDIQGRLGLVTQDYDQWLTVTPKTMDTLPLIGGLIAGNPAVGLGVLVFQRLFKKQLDQITQYRYHITGSWDDPVFERQD